MKQLLIVAAGEWRYWLRSYLVLAGVALFTVLIAITSLITAMQIQAQDHARAHQQHEAEETFLAQPDRHPHRMVHYGHYVFRNPAPLALFDSGLDPVTGQSIFLEGHRQNSAMFAESGASADLGGLSGLTPALIYQLFAPLLIILLGHSAIVREREGKTLAPLLAQGVKTYSIIFGKALAMLSFSLLLLIPLVFSSLFALAKGEVFLAVVSLWLTYFIYLAIWTILALLISSIFNKRSNVLATLTALWLGITLVLPSVAVNVASKNAPIAGKIETDLKMLSDLRELGDGHNANDPAFAKLRADLLKKYNVEKIEELPVNFRGLVAMEGERKLTEVLNEYAETRMEAENRQANQLSKFSWLTPALAVAGASRAISGTDLEHYHRFLTEAEKLRFDFVQGLNNAHVEKLSYQDDINRNKDEASWRKARVDASNWNVLDTFAFEPAHASIRLTRATLPMTILSAWLILLLAGLFWSARSLKP